MIHKKCGGKFMAEAIVEYPLSTAIIVGNISTSLRMAVRTLKRKLRGIPQERIEKVRIWLVREKKGWLLFDYKGNKILTKLRW